MDAYPNELYSVEHFGDSILICSPEQFEVEKKRLELQEGIGFNPAFEIWVLLDRGEGIYGRGELNFDRTLYRAYPLSSGVYQFEVVEEPLRSIDSDLVVKGIEVFEGVVPFLKWLDQPNRSLDWVTPLSVANDFDGVEQVLNILGRIEYGVYS